MSSSMKQKLKHLMNRSFDNLTELKKKQSSQSFLTLDDIQSKIEEFKSFKQEQLGESTVHPHKGKDFSEQRSLTPYITLGHHHYQDESSYKQSIKKNKHLLKEGPMSNVNSKLINQLQPKPIAITTSGGPNKKYIQWKEQLRGGNTSSSNCSSSWSNSNNINREYHQGLNNNQNRIKTQINLFVKQLNYQDSSSHKSSHSMSKNKAQSRPAHNCLREIHKENTSSVFSDSNRVKEAGKEKRSNKPQYKTINEILKYNSIKAIKSSIYNMSEEDIEAVPQEYIDELKALANLINTLLK